jgi:hypothetical protein
MKHETITVRNSGQIEIYNSIPKSRGHKKLNEFLSKLSKNLIERSAMYLLNVEPYPVYAYSEKSFHTILTPSIDLLTKKYLIESPIRRIAKGKRNQPRKDGHGWADYWIGYSDIEIFLELKHGWIAANSKSNNKRKLKLENLWDVMNRQLNHLEHNAKGYQIQMGKSQTFFRIGMMILPFYQWSNKKENIKKEMSHFQNIHKEISKEFIPNASWAGLFMHTSFLDDDELLIKAGARFRYLPGFMVLLNVKEIHKL